MILASCSRQTIRAPRGFVENSVGRGNNSPHARGGAPARAKLRLSSCGLLLRFFRRWFQLGRPGSCSFGLRGGSHDRLWAPEIGCDFNDFFRRIAEFRREAIERRLTAFYRVRAHVEKLLEAVITENLAERGVLVETAQGAAQRGNVEGCALRSF